MHATEIQIDELVQLNVYEPAEYFEDDHAGESWANQLCSGFGDTLYAPDFDGDTDGRSGINVLILRADLPAWIAACKELGCEYAEAEHDIQPGHYGDGYWHGVDIATSGHRWYWIERA